MEGHEGKESSVVDWVLVPRKQRELPENIIFTVLCGEMRTHWPLREKEKVCSLDER